MCNKKQSKIIPIQSDFPKIEKVQRLPEFLQFVQWFATPKQFRKPKTQKEFAKLILISEDTLTNWKNNKAFFSLFQIAVQKWMVNHVPEVIGGLYSKASNEGNAKEVEMFLKLSGMNK